MLYQHLECHDIPLALVSSAIVNNIIASTKIYVTDKRNFQNIMSYFKHVPDDVAFGICRLNDDQILVPYV